MLDMKPAHVLFVALPIVLGSCDGHVRSFRPLPIAARSGASPTEEKQRLIVALTEVASERGFTRSDPSLESDSYKVTAVFYKRIERGSVQMKLVQDEKTGRYRFVVIDWPSSSRSAESVTVEDAIRKKLEEH